MHVALLCARLRQAKGLLYQAIIHREIRAPSQRDSKIRTDQILHHSTMTEQMSLGQGCSLPSTPTEAAMQLTVDPVSRGEVFVLFELPLNHLARLIFLPPPAAQQLRPQLQRLGGDGVGVARTPHALSAALL
eukprot:6207844-Pleurochrysis_carterae.AAC.1